MPKEEIKCPYCLKLTPETKTDNCDTCEKEFCKECLTYRVEKDNENNKEVKLYEIRKFKKNKEQSIPIKRVKRKLKKIG